MGDAGCFINQVSASSRVSNDATTGGAPCLVSPSRSGSMTYSRATPPSPSSRRIPDLVILGAYQHMRPVRWHRKIHQPLLRFIEKREGSRDRRWRTAVVQKDFKCALLARVG